MWDSVGRVGLRFAIGALSPVLMGWCGYEVLTVALGWPATIALVAAVGLWWLGARMARQQLGPGADAEAAWRTALTLLGGTAAALACLLVVRIVLVWCHWLPGTATLVGCLVGLLVLVAVHGVASDHSSSTFLRGRRAVRTWQAHRRIARRRQRSTSTDPSPVWFGVQLPPEGAGTHFKIAGMNGSGKTTNIKILMSSVFPSIGQGLGHRALVYDDKQDLYPFLHAVVPPERIVTLNPFDTRCHAWDIAADVQDPVSAFQIAATLVPEETGSKERYFDDAVREVMAGVMTAFIQVAGQRWTFRDVIVALTNPLLTRLVLSQTPETATLLDTYFEARSASDIISTIRTKIAPLRPVAAAWHRAEQSISLDLWLRGEGVIVLSNDEQIRAPLQAINRVLFDRMAQLLLSQPEPVRGRTWVILDEMREAGRLTKAPDLLLRGRSKNVSVVIGFQDIAGLRELYGNNVADELTGQCRTSGYMVMDSVASREWASKLIGEAEYMDVHRTVGGREPTGTESRQRRELVLPSEFADLPRLQDDGVLGGWCTTPYCPPFYTQLEGAELDRWQVPEPDVKTYQRRDAQEQYLGEWTAEDYERLGLTQSPSPEGERPARRTGGSRRIPAVAAVEPQEEQIPDVTHAEADQEFEVLPVADVEPERTVDPEPQPAEEGQAPAVLPEAGPDEEPEPFLPPPEAEAPKPKPGRTPPRQPQPEPEVIPSPPPRTQRRTFRPDRF